MSGASRNPRAIQLPEHDAQVVCQWPSHWHFANASGRCDLNHHHLGRESNVVTSDDIDERSTLGV